jgi:hypothetical protein
VPIAAKLKTAKKEQTRQYYAERRERLLAERNDPRPQLTAPYENAPWIPQMGIINEALSKPPQPPTRDADGNMTQIRKRCVRGLHAFNSANEEEPNDA